MHSWDRHDRKFISIVSQCISHSVTILVHKMAVKWWMCCSVHWLTLSLHIVTPSSLSTPHPPAGSSIHSTSLFVKIIFPFLKLLSNTGGAQPRGTIRMRWHDLNWKFGKKLVQKYFYFHWCCDPLVPGPCRLTSVVITWRSNGPSYK